MAQKTHLKGFKLGVTEPYATRWFTKNLHTYRDTLLEDTLIRQYLVKWFPHSTGFIIERMPASRSAFSRMSSQCIIRVCLGSPETTVDTARIANHMVRDLGLMCPRSGTHGVVLRRHKGSHRLPQIESTTYDIVLHVHQTLAHSIASQMQTALSHKHVKLKTVLKQVARDLNQNPMVKRFRIECAGRSPQSLMAVRECVTSGTMPRQTLRAPIDYCAFPVRTRIRLVGVKIWIHQ